MYTIFISLFLLCATPIHSLDFIIPLPNTLILAGTSSLVTWTGLGNATAINLYLGNGPSKDRLRVISTFGQNVPNSKKSMWISMPKDTPNDNTYLILEGNDFPPSRATVPLNIGLGSTTTPSAVPTVLPSSSSSVASSSRSLSSSSHSLKPSSSAVSSPITTSHATRTTKKPSHSHSDSDSSTQTHFSSDSTAASSSSPSGGSSPNLSSGQTAGVTVGVISAVGLALGAVFFVRRNRRSDTEKRRTELFEGQENDLPGRDDVFYNGQQYGAGYATDPAPRYSRSLGHTQLPPMPYYPMTTTTVDVTHENGLQSRNQVNSHGLTGIIHKPDEVDLADPANNKPHSP